MERRAAATAGSQGSQQRFEQQRCKDVPSALRCLHIAPRGLRAAIASVHGASGRAAEVVALGDHRLAVAHGEQSPIEDAVNRGELVEDWKRGACSLPRLVRRRGVGTRGRARKENSLRISFAPSIPFCGPEQLSLSPSLSGRLHSLM